MRSAVSSRVEADSMTARRLSAIVLIPSDEVQEKNLIGYDLQVKAGLGVALAVVDGGEKKALVFGYPGTGARTFPHVVAWKLNSEYNLPFSLFRFDCEDLLLRLAKEDTLTNLDQWEQEIGNRRPLIIQIDRPEALGLKHENFHGSRSLAGLWLMRFLRKRFDRTVIFCTTSDPMEMDASLQRVFNIPIYLGPTDPNLLKRIIEYFLNRSDSDKIAQRLYKSLEKFGFHIVSGEVVHACREVQSIKDFKDLPINEIVGILESYIGPRHRIEDIWEYSKRNAAMVSFSEKIAMPHWAKWADDFKR